MAAGSRQRVFPLHLTPIESILLADDRPEYPMTFIVDMVLTGILDREAFDHALVEALQRHPLLASLIRPAKHGALCWVPATDEKVHVDWAQADVPICFSDGEWINLHDELGLRIWIRQGDTSVCLKVQFHHVCCDGIGAYRFLGDLLAYYGILTGTSGLQPTLSTIDTVRLRGRADRCRHLDGTGQIGQQIRASLKLIMQIMGRGCEPLYPTRPSGRTSQCLAYCTHSFTQSEFKEIRDAAGAFGGMPNDLLLLALFYALQQWNAGKRRRLFGHKHTVMMPVDLRDTRDYETPAANVIGYSFLTYRASDLRDRKRLTARIREETGSIRREHRGERFVDMVSMGATVNGLLPLITSVPRTLATVILSNVGDPSRRFLARFRRDAGRLVCGNLTLEAICGVPPLRPKTRGTFCISTYRQELTISLRCDPHLFSLGDTQELLNLYVEQLRQCLVPAK